MAAAALLLAGCTSLGESVEYRVVTTCEGVQHALPVTTLVSPFPAVECARIAAERGGTGFQIAQMILGGAVACSLWDKAYRWAILVLPPWGGWMREHEMRHVTGERHLPLLPFYVGSGC